MPELEPKAPADFLQVCGIVQAGVGATGPSPDAAEFDGTGAEPVVLLELFGYVPTGTETFMHSPEDPHVTRVIVLDLEQAQVLYKTLGEALDSA